MSTKPGSIHRAPEQELYQGKNGVNKSLQSAQREAKNAFEHHKVEKAARNNVADDHVKRFWARYTKPE